MPLIAASLEVFFFSLLTNFHKSSPIPRLSLLTPGFAGSVRESLTFV